ncbi:MAG: type III polyketide synthase [Halobacteriovoraceae bacterium]|nr:type III polyketide synthase [Halobacteriovoraceae bacterium]MCB9095523.1 type III polyketide synthase [Halobacteriovoraceae bacterium]
MAYLVDIQTTFPKNYYDQEQIVEALGLIWKREKKNISRLKSLHENVLVKKRHLAMPLQNYFSGMNFDERNKVFIEKSVELATEAISELLRVNDLGAEGISGLWSNTVTGFAIPSIDARVMNKLPFQTNTKRLPLLGLGCMAGVAGINRVADYLKGHPTEAVIFFSVELCSLTLQVEDFSVANLISTGLFGDGAAAVLMVGDDHPLAPKAPLKWVDSHSAFFPDSEEVMGWQVGAAGLKIILSKGVPDITENKLPGEINNFLKTQNLELADMDTFLAHPGGPKVLLAMEKVLDLEQGGLVHSWKSLEENGNMSSVSVLDIFKRTLIEKTHHHSGKWALSLAMGPAFSAELGLFQWT